MRSIHPHGLLKHGTAWLIWLALLLPMAHTAAAWHAVSHAAGAVSAEVDAGDSTSSTAPAAGHCDLCLAAAALGSGAMPGAVLVFLSAIGREVEPCALGVCPWQARLMRAYRSRAPPAALH